MMEVFTATAEFKNMRQSNYIWRFVSKFQIKTCEYKQVSGHCKQIARTKKNLNKCT
jgi:hypothetical protein